MPTERAARMQAGDRAIEVHSAGGVLVRDQEVLLISPDGRQWRLPKGRLEPGEDAADAALREVREETGVVGTIVAPLPTVTYAFRRSDGALVDKRVDFFLMQYESGAETDYDRREVVLAAWHRFDEAERRLRFEEERRLVGAARRILDGARAAPGGAGLDTRSE